MLFSALSRNIEMTARRSPNLAYNICISSVKNCIRANCLNSFNSCSIAGIHGNFFVVMHLACFTELY